MARCVDAKSVWSGRVIFRINDVVFGAKCGSNMLLLFGVWALRFVAQQSGAVMSFSDFHVCRSLSMIWVIIGFFFLRLNSARSVNKLSLQW